jgi:undecaprenyl-phosphate galactose phosphotransferase/putative colanic acid biosynthesis UDP-glucose lipid carrier transferase
MFGQQNFSAIGPVSSGAIPRAPLTRTERIAKRACDVVLAVVALILLAPLFLMTALAIKLNSVGPAIIRQGRTGFNGHNFFIYKFRTMRVTGDDALVQTRRNESRVTRVGRLLEQSSIEELPQLFNVLKGDISLVGPEADDVARDNDCALSGYAARRHLKPGIIGWARLNGVRAETQTIEQMEKRIEFELWYINNWSLVLDLKIIWLACFEHADAKLLKS